ncbi:NF-kappa-B inhibitor-interacting Ras-like protein [Lucilia cuprina]|uniref:NF-kappa-B inhibitor-interacting Ras-like protein n=1 Tax=Lucilia cuprina TaxID=7375 RepID=A0A0L0BVX5_LUCCU|nr:NF-kappa-B inhibitor-interacting Ras-like protein [Lucilia cuprina]KAI8122150.1 NF-kappa-B inhibitor-interacting Ras-like protein [Lucilia cuprina]KNC24192.1 NF-kappa-B inhibitor-interacting Ras-like protein [Lucilia cuprina]
MLTAKIGKVGKVMICGMKGVGKTALLEQLIYGNVNMETEIHPTIEDIYVASVDTGRGTRETLRIYDSAGLQGKAQLPRHYLHFPDGYVLVYDPTDPQSLDMLADIKQDIDKNKEKKEVPIIVLANMRARRKDTLPSPTQPPSAQNQADPVELILNRANSWCSRERIKHYTVNAMERPSLYEPFINLCSRLHPPQTKSSFPQLRQVMQKTQKMEG